MKHICIFWGCILAFIAIFVGAVIYCANYGDYSEGNDVVDNDTFATILVDDYSCVQETYGDNAVLACEIEMDSTLTDVISVTNIFQVTDSIVAYCHKDGVNAVNCVTDTTYDAYVPFDGDEIIPLSDAVRILKLTVVDLPNTNKVVLRKLDLPEIGPTSYYIFENVYVNAINGNVFVAN